MKKRKIFLGLALAATAVFSLSACDEEENKDAEIIDTNGGETETEGGEQQVTKYTVKFMNGTTQVESKQVEQDKVISAPAATPEKAADNENTYVFAGWFTAETGGTELTATTKASANVTYYARFTAVAREYNVIFMNGSQTFDTKNLAYNAQIVAPTTNPTKAEDDDATYEFDGWYTAQTGGTKVTEFGNVTETPTIFYARFIAHQKIAVTFMNGTTVVDEQYLAEGTAITAPVDPTKAEDNIATYTFDGWYTAQTGGEKVTEFGNATEDITYYAHFIENIKQYDIKFFDGDSEITALSDKINANTEVTKPTTNLPTQAGKRLVYWTTDKTTNIPYDFSTKISSAVNLYAVYKDATEYDTLVADSNLLANSDFYNQTIVQGSAFDSTTTTVKTSDPEDNTVTSEGQFYLTKNSMIFDLGDKKITKTGIVTIYSEVTLEGLAGEAFLQIDGTSGTLTNKEIFAIRASGGELAYRIDGGSDVKPGLQLATNTKYTIKVVIDTAEGKASIYVNGAEKASNIDVVITAINGIKFTAKADGSTKKLIDDVAITFEEKTADPFVTAKAANLASINDYIEGDEYKGLDSLLQLYVKSYVDDFKDRVNNGADLAAQQDLAAEFANFLAGEKVQISVTAYTAANTELADSKAQYVNIIENITTATEIQNQLDAIRFKGANIEGIYTDKDLTNSVDASTLTVATKELYAKVTIKVIEYETVDYTLNAENLDSGAINKKIGQFTIQGEVRGRTKTWTNPEDSNDTITWTKSFKNGPIIVNAPGNGTLTLYVQCGSSNVATKIMDITELDEDGKSTKTQYTIAGTEAVAPYGSGSPVMRFIIDVKEGSTYTIDRGDGGTLDWYQFDMTCQVEKSEVSGFEIVDTGNIDFLVGEAFDYSKLNLNKVYENGKTDTLDLTDVTIDSTAFDNTTAGEYEIKITYGEFGTKTYKVNVWSIDSLVLGFDATYKGSNTTAGNGTYVNGKVKTLYALNEKLDTNYLSLIAVAKLGSETKEFLLNNRSSKTGIAYGTLDTSTTGTKTVEVSFTTGGKTISAEYDVNVVDASPVKDAEGNYIVNVDASYTGEVGQADAKLGNRFTTISDALQFLGRSNIESATRKILTIEAGTYNEKIEITVPYLTIIGDGEDTTLIEWDSLYGCPDASGYLQVTDSTQTVAVREAAIGCNISNLTISNWWNSEERFNSVDSIAYLKKNGLYTDKVNEHRALALLVMSDQFIMNNVSLLGYQDTVEFFKGRQLLDHCYIAGTTDFIFGTNNTTFFNECEIHTIYNGSSSGGYTTAFKGASSGSSDWVQYGAIFYKCTMTADEKVGRGANANTALGRPWGSYAAVAYINCNMGDHISKKAYNGESQNARYVSMSSSTPTTATVKFVEYGNEGDGAIDATQTGMTYLDADTAKKYYDYSVIFGTENGMVKYTDAWNPEDSTIKVDPTSYYFFNANTSATGTVYNMDPSVSLNSASEPYVLGALTFDASQGNIAYNANSSCVNMKTGAKITFTVEEDSLVTIKAYSASYGKYLINGVGSTGDTLVQFYEAGTEVVFVSTGDTYINNIQIKPIDKADYTAATLSSIEVENAPTNEIAVGTEFDTTSLKVKAIYSDASYKYVDVKIDATAVNSNQPGTYEVTVTYEDKTTKFNVVYVGEISSSFNTDAVIDFTSATGFQAAVANNKITWVGTPRDNTGSAQLGTGCQFSFEVEAGATVVIQCHSSSYGYLIINGESNNSQDVTITTTSKQTITISCDSEHPSNCYIKSVTITF